MNNLRHKKDAACSLMYRQHLFMLLSSLFESIVENCKFLMLII